jgi:hypothetical protein
MTRITLMNAEGRVFQRAKIDEVLRMLFSVPVLKQTRKSPGHYSTVPALASALEQRTGAQAQALSVYPKHLIDLCQRTPR